MSDVFHAYYSENQSKYAGVVVYKHALTGEHVQCTYVTNNPDYNIPEDAIYIAPVTTFIKRDSLGFVNTGISYGDAVGMKQRVFP